MKKLSALMMVMASSVSISAQAGQWMLGGGVMSMGSEYQGWKDDGEAKLFPFFAYEGERFSLNPGALSYRVWGEAGQGLSAALLLTGGDDGYHASDADVLSGMAQRKENIEAGLRLQYASSYGLMTSDFRQDIADSHQGFLANLKYEYPVAIGNATLSPSLSVSYLSEEYVDYYYGVSSSEATASRAAYQGAATVKCALGYSLAYPLTANWLLTHSSEYVSLGDDIGDSPLTEKDTRWQSQVSVAYLW